MGGIGAKMATHVCRLPMAGIDVRPYRRPYREPCGCPPDAATKRSQAPPKKKGALRRLSPRR
jgi:hypothetical protein